MFYRVSDFPTSVKDHSVSGEQFTLKKHPDYEMLYTATKPSKEALPAYYQSESYISHTDSKQGFVSWLYQLVKRYTLSQKRKQIHKASRVSHPRILDIGAGTGDFVAVCRAAGYKAEGVEPNNSARARAAEKGIELSRELPVDQKFDVITLWHVLEHVYDLDEYFTYFQNHLNVNGNLIIAVPNYKSFDAEYFKEFWAAFDVPRHLYHFSQSGIYQLAENYHFQVGEIKPMLFDAFYVSLLSSKYKYGTSQLIRSFFIGLWSNLNAMKTGEFSSLTYILSKKAN